VRLVGESPLTIVAWRILFSILGGHHMCRHPHEAADPPPQLAKFCGTMNHFRNSHRNCFTQTQQFCYYRHRTQLQGRPLMREWRRRKFSVVTVWLPHGNDASLRCLIPYKILYVHLGMAVAIRGLFILKTKSDDRTWHCKRW
jgi:hypothetical protein